MDCHLRLLLGKEGGIHSAVYLDFKTGQIFAEVKNVHTSRRCQLRLWSESENGDRDWGETLFFPLATHSLWVGESHKLCEKMSCQCLTTCKTDFEKKTDSSDGLR